MMRLPGVQFMRNLNCPVVLAVTLVFAAAAPALAQVPEPSLRSTLSDLTTPIAADPAGFAIGLNTALEVANAPVGSSAGGFVFKLDPATGLRVRTAPTFGPSFAERAITAGEGKVSFAVSLAVATYDKLNDFKLERMELSKSDSAQARLRQDGVLSLVLSSETVVVSAAVGATDNLDLSVAVPFVKVKLDGLSWIEDDLGRVLQRNVGKISSSGLGDVAISGKLRVIRFGEDQPDPGGVALMLTTRLPTGNRENFRGLGITRVLGSALVSFGKGRLRPHGNVGFEWWEKSLSVPADFTGQNIVNARHQFLYAAGLEFEAGPKITLLFDVLGRHTRGDGSIAYQPFPVPPDLAAEGVTGIQVATAIEKGIRKATIVPGLKWNVKGSFVLSFNSLVSVWDNGLRDFFTPVFGLDWTF